MPKNAVPWFITILAVVAVVLGYRMFVPSERARYEAVRKVRAERDQGAVDAALRRLEEAARGTDNLMHPLKEALAAYATIGECCDVMRGVFGEYVPPDTSR